ncbi:MAG: TatD family hydrolase [Bacteroidales bacterium]|nr:TatD family hydrolase [Bacteroidales bacterium]
MMVFADTHTHLYDPAYENPDEAVERAVAAGVTKLLLPDTDSSVRENMIGLARRHPEHCRFAIGLHPTEFTADNFEKEMQAMLEAAMAHQNELAAIGEIGLDYYYSRDLAELQQKAFKEQILLADLLDKPVLIHCRDAFDDCIQLLKKYAGANTRGIFHAYSGSLEGYRELKRLGRFYLGIGGVVTFKNAHIARYLEEIPLEDIVLETDAPYLTPVPHRGERNESAYIPLIAQKISDIKGIPLEEVAAVTTSNAIKLLF